MATNQAILDAIANPTGGGLSKIGQQIKTSRLQWAQNRRANTRLTEEQKTAHLTRKLLKQKIKANQVKSLLSNSKILGGVTSQYMADSKTNPMLRKNPKMYQQYMADITQNLPDDVIEQFRGVDPSQFPQINRRANRMVKVLEGLEEVETYGEFEAIKTEGGKDTGAYGQPSLMTNKYANVNDYPDAGGGGDDGGKPATINQFKWDAADKALSDADLPATDATKMDYLNSYERHFRETKNAGRATRMAIAEMKQSLVPKQGALYGTNEEYDPTDEGAELQYLEDLEASGEI